MACENRWPMTIFPHMFSYQHSLSCFALPLHLLLSCLPGQWGVVFTFGSLIRILQLDIAIADAIPLHGMKGGSSVVTEEFVQLILPEVSCSLCCHNGLIDGLYELFHLTIGLLLEGCHLWLLETKCFVHCLNFLLLNGGTLSEHTVSGMPNSASNFFRPGRTALVDIGSTSTMGYNVVIIHDYQHVGVCG